MMKLLKNDHKYGTLFCKSFIFLVLIGFVLITDNFTTKELYAQTKEAMVVIMITKDGGVEVFDRVGQRIDLDVKTLITLPKKINGNTISTFTNLSILGIPGSPINYFMPVGDKMFCFQIDDVSGKYLGPCP